MIHRFPEFHGCGRIVGQQEVIQLNRFAGAARVKRLLSVLPEKFGLRQRIWASESIFRVRKSCLAPSDTDGRQHGRQSGKTAGGPFEIS
jgi:hypothetical protein